MQRTVEMLGRLGLDRDVIGAGVGEGLKIEVDGLDHQVAIERLVAVRAQRRHQRRAEGDVGDEMAVHHVEVDPVRPRRRDVAHFLAENGEVGR